MYGMKTRTSSSSYWKHALLNRSLKKHWCRTTFFLFCSGISHINTRTNKLFHWKVHNVNNLSLSRKNALNNTASAKILYHFDKTLLEVVN